MPAPREEENACVSGSLPGGEEKREQKHSHASTSDADRNAPAARLRLKYSGVIPEFQFESATNMFSQ